MAPVIKEVPIHAVFIAILNAYSFQMSIFHHRLVYLHITVLLMALLFQQSHFE